MVIKGNIVLFKSGTWYNIIITYYLRLLVLLMMLFKRDISILLIQAISFIIKIIFTK